MVGVIGRFGEVVVLLEVFWEAWLEELGAFDVDLAVDDEEFFMVLDDALVFVEEEVLLDIWLLVCC